MLASFVQTYGYAAIFVATIIEGETPVLMGGFAAHRSYLRFGWVLLTAFLAGFLGDQVWFLVGRKYGDRLLDRWPSWRARTEKVKRFLEGHPTLYILGFRFLYGLRTLSPIVLGMTNVSWARFLLLDAIGSAVWSVCFTALGYAFGDAVERFLGKAEKYELAVFAVLALAGGIALVVHFVRHRDRKGTPVAAPA